MKFAQTFFFVLFLAQLCLAQDAKKAPDYITQSQALLDQAVEKKACVGIAAGFAVAGEIKWQSGAGFSDKKEKTPFTAQTKNRLASIAKPMTAIAIMQLWEQNLLELDTPIQTYLPDFPIKKEGTITVRHLLHHSSGIGAYKSNKEANNKKEYPSTAAAVEKFKDRDLLFAPGTDFSYTSYGYVVLGLIIEQVSGMTYEAYMQKNIWDKVGMNGTGVEHFGVAYQDKASVYHRTNKGKIKCPKASNLSDRVPGGGIYSTVADMLKFGNAVLDHSLITAETLEKMQESPGLKKEGNGYGFGWYLYGKNQKHGEVFGHNGAQMGTSCFLMLLPEEQTVVMVLSNTSGALQEVGNISVALFDQANPK